MKVVVLKAVTGEKECQSCAGCGYVANDDDKVPWKYWMELPMQSAIAIQMGLVQPEECTECNGTGEKP